MINQVREVESRFAGDPQEPVRRLFGLDRAGDKLRPFLKLEFLGADDGRRFGREEPPAGVIALDYQPHLHPEMPQRHGLLWRRGGAPAVAAPAGGGFRLWLAAASLETGTASGELLSAAVPALGKTRVLLGAHKGVVSPAGSGRRVSFLDVALAPDERWDYMPPAGHNVAWLFPYAGHLQVGNHRCAGELIVFKHSNGRLSARAEGHGARLLVGTAVKGGVMPQL